jgi:hypothetical protein
MELFIALIVIVLVYALKQSYDEFQTDEDKIKQSVNLDYNYLVNQCVRDHIVLNWLTTLESRFKKFIESDEYATTVPYDKFMLNIPHKTHSYIAIRAFITVDKKRNLKLTISFGSSGYDEGRSDKYLKYCVGINSDGSDNGLSSFIEKCSKTVMAHDLEKKKKETVEKLINE